MNQNPSCGKCFLPALRGRMGDWAFYSTLMRLEEVSRRIRFADEIHANKELSRLIQRELLAGRSKEIARYLLENEDRFFNSIVVAIYGGDPTWREIDVERLYNIVDEDVLDDTTLYSMGFLSLQGDEARYLPLMASTA